MLLFAKLKFYINLIESLLSGPLNRKPAWRSLGAREVFQVQLAASGPVR